VVGSSIAPSTMARVPPAAKADASCRRADGRRTLPPAWRTPPPTRQADRAARRRRSRTRRSSHGMSHGANARTSTVSPLARGASRRRSPEPEPPCRHSACIRAPFAAARLQVSRKTRPVMCRGDGRQTGHPAAPAFRMRAGASAVESGATALDDLRQPGSTSRRRLHRLGGAGVRRGRSGALVARPQRASGDCLSDACFRTGGEARVGERSAGRGQSVRSRSVRRHHRIAWVLVGRPR
jgi:hypothetical protein